FSLRPFFPHERQLIYKDSAVSRDDFNFRDSKTLGCIFSYETPHSHKPGMHHSLEPVTSASHSAIQASELSRNFADEF
ncbi:hypothetical protein CEXT_151581, partial [Caerostris extrusa]